MNNYVILIQIKHKLIYTFLLDRFIRLYIRDLVIYYPFYIFANYILILLYVNLTQNTV